MCIKLEKMVEWQRYTGFLKLYRNDKMDIDLYFVISKNLTDTSNKPEDENYGCLIQFHNF
jgi:hypothetical protein